MSELNVINFTIWCPVKGGAP